MTNTTYRLTLSIKHSSQDIYKEGCLPDSDETTFLEHDFDAGSISACVAKAAKFLGITDKDNILINSCDEPGRIDFQVMEDSQGLPASERELKHWKTGDCKLWLCNYSAYIHKVVSGFHIEESSLQIDI